MQKIEIKNGKLTVGQAGSNAKRHEYDQMNLTASDLSYTSQFPFQFSATTPGNGSIKLTGKAGPLSQTDAAQTPVEASLEIHGLDLTSTGFVDPSSGIAGVLDFAGTLSSDGQQANSKGNNHCEQAEARCRAVRQPASRCKSTTTRTTRSSRRPAR